MSEAGGEDQILRAVQDTLGDYHRQLEELDGEFSRLTHRKEELLEAARLSLAQELPERVGLDANIARQVVVMGCW